MDTKTVVILSSAVGLGLYIPALLMSSQFARCNIETEIFFIENLLPNEKKAKIKESKNSFHKNFAFALIAQKLARDIVPLLDESLINDLLNILLEKKIRNFIMLSGFWVPIIEKYRMLMFPKTLFIDVCHIDADVSVSWKMFEREVEQYNNVWFFDWKNKKVCCKLPVSDRVPISYNQRLDRYVIHGGGWGVGTYFEKIPELENFGMKLDIVVYDLFEAAEAKTNNRYFMTDPQWDPLQRDEKNSYTFPPIVQIINSTIYNVYNTYNDEYHGFFDIISKSKAIISKPGGATLLDSLASATPLIFLDPLGYYESSNAHLWEYMGFGISYDDWKNTNFSVCLLEDMHQNLLRAKNNTLDYITYYQVR